MKKILVCFPPRRRNDCKLYFRTKQLIQSLNKGFKIKIIYPLAETGNSQNKKITLKKIFRFISLLPVYLKKISKTDFVLIFPSPLWYFWILSAKTFKKPLIIDHYTTFLSPFEKSKLPSFLKKTFFVIDRFFYKKISLIITHTQTMKKSLSSFFKIKEKKVKVIYSVVNTNLFNPQKITQKKINAVKIKYQIPQKKPILLYHGQFHKFHGVPILKEIADISYNLKKDYIFVFLGSKGKHIKNRYFLDNVPFTQLPEMLSIADLWLGRFSNNISAQRAASSCMMQAMAMQLPIITYPTEENQSIITNNQNGFLIKTLDPKTIFDKIEHLLKNSEKLKRVAKNARITIKTNFSLENWQKINQSIKQL